MLKIICTGWTEIISSFRFGYSNFFQCCDEVHHFGNIYSSLKKWSESYGGLFKPSACLKEQATRGIPLSALVAAKFFWIAHVICTCTRALASNIVTFPRWVEFLSKVEAYFLHPNYVDL